MCFYGTPRRACTRDRALKPVSFDASFDNGPLIVVGFVVSFVAAWIVVKTFLGYVQRHGFALFAGGASWSARSG